jgi:ubiquinone/menaquinone biosynthesis C-methylase UbiE
VWRTGSICEEERHVAGPRTAVSIRHPIFARLYDRLSVAAEEAGASEHRDELLRDLQGRVIEIGAGNGHCFSHYPASVTEVVAVEPEPFLRARAAGAAAMSTVPVTVVAGTAEALPADDASFDVAVFSLVLCSVPDQGAALEEAERVLRPGGQLRFYEHIVAEEPRLAKLQRSVDIVWPRLAGGCHTSRDTPRAIRDAGFRVEEERRFQFSPCLLTKPIAPHVIGLAVKPAG